VPPVMCDRSVSDDGMELMERQLTLNSATAKFFPRQLRKPRLDRDLLAINHGLTREVRSRR
jgi:hypothetical protein